MTGDTVRYESQDGIALITLNRPDRLNAIVGGMGERYADLLRQADADPGVRAIVVTGAGRGFCSGADLSMLAAGPESLIAYFADRDPDTLPTVALRIGTPVVTAVNGPCAGIGFVMAISADARFASPTATFSSTFARLGLVAEYGSDWLLTRLVGLARATDLLLTGRTITADEALAMGLVTDVADDALAAAMHWARSVADHCSPSSTAVIKGQLLALDRGGLDEALASSLEHMRASFRRPDLGEAIAARAEKRQPSFRPRLLT